eukprot:COSAG02_NODE_30248_length_554_cov_20.958242_1_plen_28_part_01
MHCVASAPGWWWQAPGGVVVATENTSIV